MFRPTSLILGALIGLLLALLLSPAEGADDWIDVTVRMSKEQYALCQKWSCTFLTPADVEGVYQKGVDEGVTAFKTEHVDMHGCVEGDS